MRETLAFLKEDGAVKSNRGDKYKNLVKPIYEGWLKASGREPLKAFGPGTGSPKSMQQQKIGEGCRRLLSVRAPSMLKASRAFGSIQSFVFLPLDVNELADRHRLLILEMGSGNTKVFNELQAIIDDLLRLRCLIRK